jgi:hypothetical protein
MYQYKLPYFEAIDLDSLEEYYSASTPLNGNEIQLDLNFDDDAITLVKIEPVKSFLES